MIGEAVGAELPEAMRQINVGVAVAPPNVVHTAPYVAKALGFFAKHCIDANIIQFEGGQSQTANVAVAQGSAIISVNDVLVGRGMKVQQIWGLAPRMPQAYMVQEGITKPSSSRASGCPPPAAASAASTGAWAARCCARSASTSTTRSSSRRRPPAGCRA